MNTSKNWKQELKKDLIVCLKLTLIFGVIFTIINQRFTLKGASIVFLFSAMYSFILALGNGFVNQFLNTKWDWVAQTNQRVWAGIVATVLYTVIAVFFIHYVQYVVIFKNSFSVLFSDKVMFAHVFAIVLSLGIAAFFHARGFMIEWKKSVSQETTQQQIVAKTESAKFETLKSQIDPHFLFNSLNVLTSLIGENPDQAERFTTKLSKVYRYVLEQRNKELVPIEEELQFAKTYMELLQMRFEDALEFQLPSSVTNPDLKIVPLSLQLLLENAVKHNVVSSSKPLKIAIYEEAGYLKIQNNINPKEAIGKSTKVGLQNIADRYGLISEQNIQIENNRKTFIVSLPLLVKSENIMNTSDNNFENNSYVKAVERVQKIKEFYQNLTSYVIFIPLLIFINLKFSPQFHWFWFPVAGWGIGVIFHGLEAFGYNLFLGKDWEERKIKEMMNKNKF
ncbi:2TM domain-containing protein [Tenacibaculum sp. IB213877]|uniref:2TM domain-containing protein n=1 Tax=Tenacibaculum sp. IB213877 TaxID=3097351 RepID=UPI002A5A440B|nr:2TM domain-containing protein [Tenacibaculum sp. IB213877]MDY0779228.1 histidine kinase [Tenacibaculum sp. IB213877]